MDEGLISQRYAKAILRYATELNVADQVYEKMKVFQENYLSHPDLQKALMNPVLSPQDKEMLLSTAIGIEPGEAYLRGLRLLIRNHREAYMRSIALQYQKLYRKANGIIEVNITTAREVGKEELSKIKEKVKSLTSRRLEFIYTIDPSLIGGFILRMGEKQLDLSVRKELKQIKDKLSVGKPI